MNANVIGDDGGAAAARRIGTCLQPRSIRFTIRVHWRSFADCFLKDWILMSFPAPARIV